MCLPTRQNDTMRRAINGSQSSIERGWKTETRRLLFLVELGTKGCDELQSDDILVCLYTCTELTCTIKWPNKLKNGLWQCFVI